MKKELILQINNKDYFLRQETWLMGVLNITPDSFSDGGLYLDKEKAVERGLELISEGSDIIDVGGESSRPGAEPIAAEEEMKRILPVISELKKRADIPISVDTMKANVAEAAIEAGADMVNDISAFRSDPRMLPLLAQKAIPVVVMHMKGTPKTMQMNPRYENVVEEVKAFLQERIVLAEEHGIGREKIIIDPGIGFGKRLEDNLTLINNLHALEELDRPLMVGVSRKSFIGKILNLPPQERIEGTIASSILCIIHGAHILRVHDVASVKRAITVAEAILGKNHDSSLYKEREKRKNSYVS